VQDIATNADGKYSLESPVTVALLVFGPADLNHSPTTLLVS